MFYQFGNYTIENVNNSNIFIIHILDKLTQKKITIPMFCIEDAIGKWINDKYIVPTNIFVIMFERAFNDDKFGDTDLELEFLKNIPKDFNANHITDKNKRFNFIVNEFLIIFNKLNNYDLELENILPYLEHCR